MKEYTVKVYEDRTEWFLNGKYHREDGPAVEYANGSKVWYLNGKRHREDGPAIEYLGGHKVWYLHGKMHREDGPAIECADGSKAWYLNGKKYTKAEFIVKTPVKEMTMEELCKELGITIKIIK